MTLEVAVLGYRFMGQAHANALARLPMFFPDAPDVERSVLVGRDETELEDAATRLEFQSIATDWADVIDDADVFYNLGPNHLHAEPSIAALEAGTPVFCEKPLAATLSDAEAMTVAARDAGVPAGCAFNYRFVPAIQYAKRLIDDGELGEVRVVRARYLQDWLADPDTPWSWRNDAEVAGFGALGDIGSHSVDLARFLVADQVGEIERVSGHLTTFIDERPVGSENEAGSVEGEGEAGSVEGEGEAGSVEGEGESEDDTRPVTVDDTYTAQAEFESGAVGTFEASQVVHGHKNDNSIEIHGTDGSLRFSLERLNELEVCTGDARGYETILVTDEDDPYLEHWWPPGHVLGWEHTFVHENYEFLRAVANGGESGEYPTFEDGLAVQRVLEAIAKSDERGEWVVVE